MDEVIFDGLLYKPVSKMGFELSQLLCRLCVSELIRRLNHLL